jgi:hypothetical protein
MPDWHENEYAQRPKETANRNFFRFFFFSASGTYKQRLFFFFHFLRVEQSTKQTHTQSFKHTENKDGKRPTALYGFLLLLFLFPQLWAST